MRKSVRDLYNEQQKDASRRRVKPQFFQERRPRLFEEISCPRKRAIWLMYKTGTHSNREMAAILNLNERTVRYHIDNLTQAYYRTHL